MPSFIENSLLYLIDRLFEYLPQKTPNPSQLSSCKLVSHRGERDNKTIFENTFAAFDPIRDKKIWGMEIDIRWTLDLIPVVIHDSNALRVFGKDFIIADNTWHNCQQELPLVPSLEQFIERYAKHCHLMIELKEEHYPKPEQQKATLQKLLSTLKPQKDFHIIALNTKLFEHVDFLPKLALLPVSTTNTANFSRQAINKNYGGITGHFLLMTRKLITKHHQSQQKVGTGFANSKNALFREIHRKVDWVFTNRAIAIHQIITTHIKNA